jgi:hypothetical protein
MSFTQCSETLHFDSPLRYVAMPKADCCRHHLCLDVLVSKHVTYIRVKKTINDKVCKPRGKKNLDLDGRVISKLNSKK